MSPIEKPGNGQSGAASTGGAKPSFMHGASAAKEVFEQQEQKREEERGKFFRFSLKGGELKQITFLDGHLNEKGLLEAGGGFYYEHTSRTGEVRNGRAMWDNFVCLKEIEAYCPICLAGDKPAYVGYFTVLNHTPFKGKVGTYVDQKQLYVAKESTIEKLQKRAAKHPTGLVGMTLDVSRSNQDKSPRVGDDFDVVGVRSLEEIHAAYPKSKVDEAVDYSAQVIPTPGIELIQRSLGKAQGGSSFPAAGGTQETPPAEVPDPSEVPF